MVFCGGIGRRSKDTIKGLKIVKAYIIVDLAFGDSGKGSVTDFLCRVKNADLNVRYNGGHQAAHNVVLPNGTHHTFRQFGSGTFFGCSTYLGRHMIIEPIMLAKEASELACKGIDNPMGNLFINTHSLVTTPWHALLNRMQETYRGNSGFTNRHGSCGVGVGTTRKYWLDYGTDALTAKDCREPEIAAEKMELIKQRLVAEADNFGCNKTEEYLNSMYEISATRTAAMFKEILDGVTLTNRCPSYKVAIFEGAHGVLLDQDYGFHPYTTWSTTTSKHAIEEIECLDTEIETIGVLRTYHTRHGNGPFPSFDKNKPIPEGEHNSNNEWQREFKVGDFDIPLAKYAIKADGNIDSLFFTCLDHLENGVECAEYRDLDNVGNPVPSISFNSDICKILFNVNVVERNNKPFSKIPEILGKPLFGVSRGPTYKDKSLTYRGKR